jgi:oligoribonuclease (3'-5' exoribonuclease)
VSTTYLLWCDLETTGLDLKADVILEAAFILTDSNLDAKMQSHHLFPPSQAGWDLLLANEFVRKMHAANGLVAELVSSGSRLDWQAENAIRDHDVELEGAISRHLEDGDTLHLAGSGIAAFDRPLIDRDFPLVSHLLHYAPIDVGVLKRTWQMWAGQPISTDDANKTHRAMADVEGHLREARLFRDEFRAAVAS